MYCLFVIVVVVVVNGDEQFRSLYFKVTFVSSLGSISNFYACMVFSVSCVLSVVLSVVLSC